jgi:hypothetical protein
MTEIADLAEARLRRRRKPPMKRKATMRIDSDLWDALEEYAEVEDITLTEAFNELLDWGLQAAEAIVIDAEEDEDEPVQ